MKPYRNSGPMNCNVDIDTSKLEGKTAIVTGGAKGIGAEYVRRLTECGVNTVIADVDEEAGEELQHRLGLSATFVKCDVTNWQDQAAAFKRAKGISPTGKIDIVVVNAGIGAVDDVFNNDTSADEPDEPKMISIQVNFVGAMYTTKLAMWYFAKQRAQASEEGKQEIDQCLLIQGSSAGYTDLGTAPQYTSAKFAMRGLMRSLRRTGWMQSMRVNLIAPWYIRTTFHSPAFLRAVDASGQGFANIEDAGSALLRIICDRGVVGRSICIAPRDWPGAPRGYFDLDNDHFQQGMHPAIGSADNPLLRQENDALRHM